MSQRRRPYVGPSDAQSNAEALARRSSTYADPHARSWEARFGGNDSRTYSTRALVIRLTGFLAEETPERIHEGPDQIDAGGTPAMTGAFLAYIDGGAPGTLERPDPEGFIVGTYRRPLASAIESMTNCKGKVAWWGRIVERIVYEGEPPVDAARAEGSHQYEAARTANEALSEAHRRYTLDKMHLPKREAVA